MSIVQERKEYYLQQRNNRGQNKINGIPWYLVFPKLGKLIPSIPKNYQILLTANSGVGRKTTLKLCKSDIFTIFVGNNQQLSKNESTKLFV